MFLKGFGQSEIIIIVIDWIFYGSYSLCEKLGKFLGKFVESVFVFQFYYVKLSFKEEFYLKE